MGGHALVPALGQLEASGERLQTRERCEILPLLPAPGEFAGAALPTTRNELTRQDFDDDYFQLGKFAFVSEKMRRVMALGPTDIQYFDVDPANPCPCRGQRAINSCISPWRRTSPIPTAPITRSGIVPRASSYGRS